jgi:hypothetical protein
MKWDHPRTPWPKKFGTDPSAGKQMTTICWDTQRILLNGWLPIGMTIKRDRYWATLTRHRGRIQQQCKQKWQREVLLQYDNAHPHTSHKT